MQWLIVLMFFLLSVSSAKADEGMEEWGKFASGLATGFLTHEAGHQTVAWANGTHLSWSLKNSDMTWFAEVEAKKGKRLRDVALGATAAEMISSELILDSNASKGSSYFIGWLSWNIITPWIYTLRDTAGGYGDLEAIRQNEHGLKVEYVIAAKLAHSLFTGCRLWNNKDFQESRIKFYITPAHDSVMALVNIKF